MNGDADRDLSAVLESIDGALADSEFPDAMRWSPTPDQVDAPPPFDGTTVWQPPQRYEVVPGAWVREYDRDHPRPGFLGGAVPDRVILDEAFSRLIPPEVDRDTLAGQWAEAAERVGVLFRDLVSAFAQAFESLGRLGSNLRPLLDQLREAGVIPTEAPEDPRARAMWHKARQGTGPDTQIQHRPRPRRHTL